MKGLALDSGEFISADELNAKWLPRKATKEEMGNLQAEAPKPCSVNTAKLKKLAEAAPLGRWQAYHDHGWLVVASDNEDIYIKIEKGSAAKKHLAAAKYIAAANPAAIIELLAINAEPVEALKNLLKVHEGEGGTKYHAGDIARAALAKAEEVKS